MEKKKTPLTNPMESCLRDAARSPDGTVLARGYNSLDVHAKVTANALARHGLLDYVKHARWGTVFRITLAGRERIARQ